MFADELKEVPTGELRSKYWISSKGKLYSITNEVKEVKPYIKDNELWVGVVVNGAPCEWRVSSVVALCFCNIKLFIHDVNKILPIFKDGDSGNISAENITYRFDGPLEDSLNPGYYIIPFNTNYAISINGVAINRFSKNILTWTLRKATKNKNPKGAYRVMTAIHDLKGIKTLLSRHRSMCLVFNGYTTDPAKLVTNHKDGIPGNDWPDNLELNTHSQNTKHAYANNLHPDQNIPVCYKNWKTGLERRYNSIADASADLDLDWCFIKLRTEEKRQGKRYKDGHCFKLDDGKPWLALEETEIRGLSDLETAIIAHNVFTGESKEFLSITLAADALKIEQGTISAHIRHNRHHPIDGYVFRKKSDNPIFPKFTERDILTFKAKDDTGRMNKPILAVNRETKEETFFPNSHIAGEYFGMVHGHMTKMARWKRSVKGFDLSFYEIPTNY